ncbi:MAG: hypothetical protein ACRCVA_18620 [Phreatobacter sp.]
MVVITNDHACAISRSQRFRLVEEDDRREGYRRMAKWPSPRHHPDAMEDFGGNSVADPECLM